MLRIVPHTVPRFGRSYEHFPDGFELHLLLPSNNEEQMTETQWNAGSELGGQLTVSGRHRILLFFFIPLEP